jgi:hypothetical protein
MLKNRKALKKQLFFNNLQQITIKKMKNKKIHKSSFSNAESDFKLGDNAYAKTRFHKAWFELLKIHPGIRYLHEHDVNQATTNSLLTNDLIKTYEDFKMGEVLKSPLPFKDWWWKYGQYLFNSYTNKEGLHVFAAIQKGESNEYAKGLCEVGIKDYLNIYRSKNEMEGFLAMTVSLSGDRKQMLRRFDHILSYIFKEIEKNPTPEATLSQYKILPGVQIDTVNRLLSLLHKAIDLHDVQEQWKIGFDVGVYKSGTQGYTYKTLPSKNKTTLIEHTSREFKRAKNLLENAANGKFPCTDNIDSNPLDYKEMFDFRETVIQNERKLIRQREKAAYQLKAKQNKENIELQRLQYEALNKI